MPAYQILQWTPFPDKYEPLPEWQLQTAELELKLNRTYYYENAVRTKTGILYPLEIANRIVDYWQKKWRFAKYQLIVGTITTDPATGELKVNLPPEFMTGAFSMFIVGNQQYRRNADGQLFKVLPTSEDGKVNLIPVNEIDPTDRPETGLFSKPIKGLG